MSRPGASAMALAVVLVAAFSTAVLADIYFPGVPFQFSNLEKHSILSTKHAIVGRGQRLAPNTAAMANGMKGGFQLLTRTGMPGVPGDAVDAMGKPIMKFAGANFARGAEPERSVAPDYTTLIPRKGDPNRVDLFVHFESPNPASLYHVELIIASDGALTPLRFAPVDFSAVGGVMSPCAGSLSPWGTHLGSEESDPDARSWFAGTVSSRARDYGRYWGLYPADFNTTAEYQTALRAVFNPYRYGYVTEVSYDAAAGRPTARKWYTLGRGAIEAGLVMPDRKTVYITDDGRNIAFYKFVADKAGDLSAGRLYAARFTQLNDTNGGTFDIEWRLLSRLNQAALAAALPNTTFAQIFDYAAPSNGTCPDGFKGVKTLVGEECLRLVPGAEMLAAAFESRRYSAYIGATTEWSKWEGITYDSKRHKLYTSMSYIDQGCLPEPKRFGGEDHIRIPANKCGCVYSLDLDAAHSATRMASLTCGIPDQGVTVGKWENNTCHTDRIANPDNVHYWGPTSTSGDPDRDLLFITEDTDYHENAFLWALNLPTGELTRILSAPVASENTGVGVFTLPNGMTYVWNNIQHPYAGVESALAEPEATGLGGYMGYFGPFKLGRGETLGLQGVPSPTDNAAKHGVVSSPKAVIGMYTDATYNILARSGDVYGEEGDSPLPWGSVYDAEMRPVHDYNTTTWQPLNKSAVSNSPDFSSLTAVCDEVFLTTQFEWPNPGSMYITSLDMSKDGHLTPTATKPIDWSAWGGLWVPCAGSVSPWGSRLGSEEYEPDARIFEFATSLEQLGGGATPAGFTYFGGNGLSMARNFGLQYGGGMTLEDFKEAVRPYLYGYITEVKVQIDASYVIRKHYVLGRVASEMALAMPDGHTVYVTDDGSNVGWYKFVSDEQSDLTSGNLYAAKMTQLDGRGGGRFRVDWVWLGHGSSDAIMAAAPTTVFSDIFETAAPVPLNATAAAPSPLGCPEGFRPVNQGEAGICECLRVRPGMETLAAFFETRRYAAYRGATTEWSKWEGMTYDPKRNRIYTSISDVRNGMEDYRSRGAASVRYDQCTSNDVRLEWNRCGCVYSLALDGSHSAYAMDALLCGTPLTNPTTPGFVPSNNCHMDRIASPDNVAMMAEHDTLLIGEDTSEHQNDVVWAYDLGSGSLTRIFTTPYGAETTSPYWYPNVNGFAYILATGQHPYGESDAQRANDPESFGFGGAAGLIGPLPSPDAAAAALAAGTRPSTTRDEDCEREAVWAADVQVSYTRSSASAAELARLDAHVLARVDVLLARHAAAASGAHDMAGRATRVASTVVTVAAGEEEVAVVARVQLGGERVAAAAAARSLSDPMGPFQADLAAMFAALSGPAPGPAPAPASPNAIASWAVDVGRSARMNKRRAYRPPQGRIA